MLTKQELIQVRLALRKRDEAEAIIKEAREKLPGKNKTHALRRLLKLCPECGGPPAKGHYYCDPCRLNMNARHRKKKGQL